MGSSATADAKAAAVVSLMTRDEKLSLVHGASGWTYNTDGYTGIIPAVTRLCLPRMTMKDGPNGLRLTGTTNLPTGEVLASSWDPSLAKSYGAVLGQESRTTGVDVLLGPTVNLVRDSRWGRADETYGEDPLLAGAIGTGTVQGIQSAGVIAELKHYAAYNQETNRQAPADTVVASDRTMHELYTRQFADIVANAKPGAIMCSYNRVDPYSTNADGTRTSIGPTQSACSSSYLSNILHAQNGFQGWVGTDWNAAYRGTTLDSVNAGLNIQTPGDDSDVYNAALAAAVAKGYVTDGQLSGLVRPIVRSEFQFGLVDSPKTGTVSTPSSTPEHQAAALKIAQNGTVLLKNTDAVLPLSSTSVGSIAMFGDDTLLRNSGTTPGSSGAPLAHTAIATRAGSGTTTTYDPSTSPTANTAAAAAAADVAIVFVNKVQNEGRDAADLSLPSNENDLVSAVAAANPNTIVVMNTSAAVLMPWLPQVKGVMEAWLGGEQGGNALASLVFGDVNPSGKLPLTFPASIEQSPTSTVAQWPGDGSTVDYSEGLDMGYRWFNDHGVTPVFPFGYGLSYSSFQFSNLRLSQPYGTSGANVSVSFTVRNTGAVTGSDVGQVYLTKPNTLATSPPNQLVGFKKVTLAPGTSTKVTVNVPAQQLGYWDEGAQAWTVQDGSYRFAVGDSSASLPLAADYDVTSSTGPVRLALSGAPATVATGSSFQVKAKVSDVSDFAVKNGSVELTGPKGWTATPSSAGASPAKGATVTRTFRVTAPTTATPGNNRVSMTLTGLVDGKRFSVTQAVTVTVPFRTLAAATTVVGTTTTANRDAGNFDGRGDSYSAEALAANGFGPGASIRFPDGGTTTFPTAAPGTYNALTAGGQTIALTGRGTALALVGASTRGAATGTVTVTYTDGTTSTGTLSLGDWTVPTPPAGAVALTTVPWNQRSTATPLARQVTLFGQELPIRAGKTVASVTLPSLSSVGLFSIGVVTGSGV
ncbi:glycoside hydrolase family 3 C-terminal domain-containing protein [Jatrophihabitans sp. YIM 134969]